MRYALIASSFFLFSSNIYSDNEVKIRNDAKESVNVTLRCYSNPNCSCDQSHPRYSPTIQPGQEVSMSFDNASCVLQYVDFWLPGQQLGRIEVDVPVSFAAKYPFYLNKNNQGQWIIATENPPGSYSYTNSAIYCSACQSVYQKGNLKLTCSCGWGGSGTTTSVGVPYDYINKGKWQYYQGAGYLSTGGWDVGVDENNNLILNK